MVRSPLGHGRLSTPPTAFGAADTEHPSWPHIRSRIYFLCRVAWILYSRLQCHQCFSVCLDVCESTNTGRYSASSKCRYVGTSTWTHLAVLQNDPDPDPYFTQALGTFSSRICHDRSYLPDKVAFNAKSAVSQPLLVGNPPWPWVAPLATDSVAATPDVSANAWN